MEAPYCRIIAQSLLARIRAWLEKAKEGPSLLEEENAVLPADFQALGAIHEMFMKSCLMGMDAAAAAKKKAGGNFADPDGFTIEALPFEQAVQFLNTQIPLGKKSYYALDDRLRLRAFTVGRLNDADAINKVKGIIAKGLEQGGTVADFYKMTDEEILNGIGFGKGNMGYWETVYRTNTSTIQNAGRAMAFGEVPPLALELVGIKDARQTDICRSLTETPFIRKYDDPVWRSLWPPFHFNCRTTIRGIYDPGELREYGGIEAAQDQGAPVKPEPDFGSYPLDKESYWRLTPEMIDRAREYGIDGDIADAAVRLGMPQYAFDLLGGSEILYPETTKGGMVMAAGKARPGTVLLKNSNGDILETDELGLAKKAADEGYQVYFMPRSNNAPSPDIIINDHVGDIKHVFTVSKGSITGAINTARKEQKATAVLLEVSDDFTKAEIDRQVQERLRNSRHLQFVLVRWQGKLYRYQ